MSKLTATKFFLLLLTLIFLGCATKPDGLPSVNDEGLGIETTSESDPYLGLSADELIDSWEIDFLDDNYEEGVKKLKSAYLKGSSRAAYLLGIAMRDWIPETDISKSIDWFRLAADEFFEDAYIELALTYYMEEFGLKDYRSAHYWAEKASMAGIDTGTFILGDLYYFGLHVEKDLRKARELYEASMQGSRDSLYSAGYMQLYGQGGPIDAKSAISNLTRYIENTKGKSIFDFTYDAYDILGSAYAGGYVVEQDSEIAFNYFSRTNGATHQSAGYLAVFYCLGIGTNPDQNKCELHTKSFFDNMEDEHEAEYWEEYVITSLANHFLLDKDSSPYSPMKLEIIDGLGKLSEKTSFASDFVFGIENALVFTGNLKLYEDMLGKLAEDGNSRAMYTIGIMSSQGDDIESKSKSFRYLYNAYYYGSEKALPFIENRIFPGWKFTAATKDELYFLIGESIKTKGNRLVFAWNAVVDTPEFGDDYYKFFVKQKNYYVYDCLNETSAFRSLVTYDVNENVVSSRNAEKLEYSPVVPGSIGEAMLENVCANLTGFPTEFSEGEPSSVGTGWPVVGGYVVTNYHVVQGAKTINLFTKAGTKIPAEIAITDKVNDIALLRVSKTEDLPRPLKLADDAAQQGMQVATIGYPHPDIMGADSKVTTGIINATTGMGDDPRFLQISVPVQSGNSGGPLLDLNGSVYGVVTSKLSAIQMFQETGDLPQNVNYAIKSIYIKPLLMSLPTRQVVKPLVLGKDSTLEELSAALSDSIMLIEASQ